MSFYHLPSVALLIGLVFTSVMLLLRRAKQSSDRVFLKEVSWADRGLQGPTLLTLSVDATRLSILAQQRGRGLSTFRSLATPARPIGRTRL